MKIVIAPDSFKESLAADQVAKAIQEGFMEFFPEAEYHLLPVADGGEGTIQALASANDAVIQTVSVKGPLSEPTQKIVWKRWMLPSANFTKWQAVIYKRTL
jgi:glycerate kinase